MNKEKAKEEYKFYSEELIKYQTEETVAVNRLRMAEICLADAEKELADAKESLAGIRGGITVFVSELQRLEKVIKSE